MLVLTRKLNEKIIIGDHIEIVLLNIESGQVQLGIQAPKHIRILREEIFRGIVDSNVQSADINPNSFEKAINILKAGEKS